MTERKAMTEREEESARLDKLRGRAEPEPEAPDPLLARLDALQARLDDLAEPEAPPAPRLLDGQATIPIPERDHAAERIQRERLSRQTNLAVGGEPPTPGLSAPAEGTEG